MSRTLPVFPEAGQPDVRIPDLLSRACLALKPVANGINEFLRGMRLGWKRQSLGKFS